VTFAEAATPVLDRAYALQDTGAALAYIESGHALGRVVITLQVRSAVSFRSGDEPV
jgi:hypothetical protein